MALKPRKQPITRPFRRFAPPPPMGEARGGVRSFVFGSVADDEQGGGHIPAEEDLPRKVGGGVLTLPIVAEDLTREVPDLFVAV